MAIFHYRPDTRPIPKPHLFKRAGRNWWCVANPREGDYPANNPARGKDPLDAYKHWLDLNGLCIAEWRSP
jgi:hypothetical protein